MTNLDALKNDEILKPFLDKNPEFDLESFDFNNEEAVDALNWEDLNKDIIIERLFSYQYLPKLGVTPDEAKQIWDENLEGTHQTRDYLLGIIIDVLDLDRTGHPFSIAMGGSAEEENEEDIAAKVTLDAIAKSIVSARQQKTRAINTRAVDASAEEDNEKDIAAKVTLDAIFASIGSPHQQKMRANNTTALYDNLQERPSYQKLFGSLDYLQCDPCQSIYSPAAYFVDLMRIVDKKITEPNKENKNFISLEKRRLDLWEIPLTCDYTNETVFYTKIVRDVLEKQFLLPICKTECEKENIEKENTKKWIKECIEKKVKEEEIFKQLATAKYPHSLPFNANLEQIRTYLGHQKTNIADIYQTFHLQEPYSKTWAREYLGLSPEEYQLITTVKIDDLNNRYGVTFSESDMGGLNKKDVFLKQTGLSWEELNNLLYQNLSPDEKKNENSVAHQFYINGSLSDNKYLNLKDGIIENLDKGTLDRINRFLRLPRKLGWSFADLDWVIASIKAEDINEEVIVKIAKIKYLQAKTKLPLDVLCSFWHDMKTYGKGDNDKRPQDLFDRVFNNPFTIQGQEKWQSDSEIKWKIEEVTSGEDKHESSKIRQFLLAALQLRDDELTNVVEGIWSQENEVKLDVTNLSILYRNALVLKLLRLKAKEYQLLLKIRGKEETLSLQF